ncbi:MAG: hypothetical protein HKO81_01305 [Flavobacteriaceae bacterium]|nr:hypothetical protein [Flavobacteriaceae bacterium]
MIKFFRKIRHNLLTENKFSKYLLYAIGEIVLVVIGILIALQINNWNESRKDRIEEKETLKNLTSDLESALLQLNVKIRQNRTFFVADSILLDVISHERQLPKDSLEKLILGHLITPTFNPEMGNLNEIISSGKLNLIKNDSLRNHISSWNKSMDELGETNEKLIHYDKFVKYPLYASEIPVRNVFSTVYKSFEKLQFSRSRFDWNPENLLDNLEFENMLSIYILHSSVQTSRHLLVKNRINEMLVLIDKELNSD